ncbi:MAG TPA: M13 family metallopeptidase [Flavisolibacter sp.]|nr:M13 family metallopeptidase [Flavisolibacter sp.]
MRYVLFSAAAMAFFFIPKNSNISFKNLPCADTSVHDILKEDIDPTVDPSQDFFLYANGRWIKNNPIPDDQSSWGIGNAVQEEIYKRLKTINVQSLKASTGIAKKVGDFWYSAMDTVQIEKQKLMPVQKELNQVNSIKTKADLINVASDLQIKGIGNMFSSGAGQDAKQSDVMAYYLVQGGLGLPNRDYYFNTDDRTVKIRKAYSDYVTQVFMMLGSDKTAALKKSAEIIKLETELAKSSRKLEDLRDPYSNYNKFAITDLSRLTPSISWKEMLARKNVKHIDSVIVGQPEFYKELEVALNTTPIETWKDYLRFHLIASTAPYLDNAAYQSYFNFYGRTLRGAKIPKARWKRMLDQEDGLMGEALGHVFVKEYFNENAKRRYSDLVEDIRATLKEHIQKLEWMSDSTKQKALYKLSVMKKKVGYPDKWKDFSAMEINRQPLVRNVLNANIWWHNYDVNKLGKPVDREEWDMNPQTYNAYYNPSNNEIVLPAGIFTVPGFRDEQLDDALVYGYAGASTIGHEITHGFDDEGRQFDAVGNLSPWWTATDSAAFTNRAQVMVNQFNSYVVVDSAHINGKATLGENIADLGGILLGLDAFKKTEAYKSGKLINGMTPLQRYFLGYALGWLGSERKEALASQVMTDVHSPAKYRVNGPFSDVDEFYKAFNIQQGTPMYRQDSLRVHIW